MTAKPKVWQRSAKSFPVVKPDATAEEVAAVVDNTDGAGGQIFSKAVRSAFHVQLSHLPISHLQLSTSTAYGQSRTAYKEVQDRHEDIKKIERTIEELAQLFNDVRFFTL